MLTVGLTGGIGSGKSTVARLFAELGVTVIDADVIAREVVKIGKPAYQEILLHFGADILTSDKTIDRSKLREIIFADSQKREWLEKLLHPIILQELFNQAKQAKSEYCILIIPLLFEAKLENDIHRILVVDAEEELQIQRVTQRDKVSKEQISATIKAQISRQKRLEATHDVIDNNQTLDDLKHQVEFLHRSYLALAKKIH